MSREVVFVTSNRDKFREAEKLITPLGYTLRQENPGYPELQSSSLEEVVSYAIECLEDRFDLFFLEDSGMFIEELKGFPGVYSKFVFSTIGNRGIITLMEGKEKRDALFRTVIGFYEGEPKIFKGECKGKIAENPKGTHGFGYDPVFIPEGDVRTFGEMEIHEKNLYSHRGNALKELIRYLEER